MPIREGRSEPPAVHSVRDGLAYTLHLPIGPVVGGVVILHGAGSSQASHLDFALRCATRGLAALRFDLRGHGSSAGALDERAPADVAAMTAIVREAGAERVGLRGSSMGGWLALTAAAEVGAEAVVAICPASSTGLRAGLREGRFDFAADAAALESLLERCDEDAAARTLGERLLLVHAEGDEVVPVERSRALHAAAPGSELLVVPGGHHRSAQHDPALQDATIRFLRARLDAGAPPPQRRGR